MRVQVPPGTPFGDIMNRNKKTESFTSLRKSGRFAKTSLNDMRKAGRDARKALLISNDISWIGFNG